MTPEEKNLLLKELCARLPYGIRIECGHSSTIMYDIRPDTGIINNMYSIDKVKPYLRPMYAMTEKEKEQFEELTYKEHEDFETTTGRRMILATDSDTGYGSEYFSEDISEVVDWLNSHHIDYRDLIEKELALEAPEGMYKTE